VTRWSTRPALTAAAVAIVAGVGLGYAVWPRGSAPASTLSASTVSPSTSPGAAVAGSSPAEATPPNGVRSSVAGSPAARGGLAPVTTGARAGDSSVSVTPLLKPSLLPSTVALSWAGWKLQASAVCRLQELPRWAGQLTRGSDAAATDPASKRYAVRELGTGADTFHSVLSGLGVTGTPADRTRRSTLLDAAKRVADTARVPGSVDATSAAWQQVATALAADSIGC
jgi:hypothetical protein